MHFKKNFDVSLRWLLDRIEVDLFNHSNVMTAILDDVIDGSMSILIANLKTNYDKNSDAEGFKNAKKLAAKVVSLFRLMKQLLST